MRTVLPFPRPDEVRTDTNVPQREYPPFRSTPHDLWLQSVLEHMRVEVLSAIRWHTTRRWRIEPRRMPFDSFHLFVKGRGTVRIESRERNVTTGDCVHFRRGVTHSATTDPANPFVVISLRYGSTVFESLSLAELLGFPDVFRLDDDRRVLALFEEACRECALRPVGYGPGLEALGMRILLDLIREHGDQLDLRAQPERLADLERLFPALKCMQENLAEPPTMSALARSAGLSSPQFRRVFERAMGTAPVQYLRRIRIERACLLLERTNHTVESIAAEVGYAQPAFFAATFKKLVGVSPGKYRTTHEP